MDALVDRATELPDDVARVGGRREEMEALFREAAPEVGRSADEVLERAMGEILPRAARIDHPRFFAFVPGSPTWPSVLAEFLTAGFNIFQGTWLASAGPSQIELVVLDWFREWLGMPAGSEGLLTSGGSAANLGALVAARERAGNPPEGVVYFGDQGHSSLERATRIGGIAHVRKVPTGDDFAVEPVALERAIQEDRANGLSPFMMCANAGATNTIIYREGRLRLECLNNPCFFEAAPRRTEVARRNRPRRVFRPVTQCGRGFQTVVKPYEQRRTQTDQHTRRQDSISAVSIPRLGGMCGSAGHRGLLKNDLELEIGTGPVEALAFYLSALFQIAPFASSRFCSNVASSVASSFCSVCASS